MCACSDRGVQVDVLVASLSERYCMYLSSDAQRPMISTTALLAGCLGSVGTRVLVGRLHGSLHRAVPPQAQSPNFDRFVCVCGPCAATAPAADLLAQEPPILNGMGLVPLPEIGRRRLRCRPL